MNKIFIYNKFDLVNIEVDMDKFVEILKTINDTKDEYCVLSHIDDDNNLYFEIRRLGLWL